MKLLIDECLPRTLKRLLGDHECRTVQEMGWSGKKNGVLLSLAELEFDVLVTVDQGMEYEQTLRIAGWQCSCSLGDRIRSKIWSPSSQPLLPRSAASILGARFGLGQNESLTLLQEELHSHRNRVSGQPRSAGANTCFV